MVCALGLGHVAVCARSCSNGPPLSHGICRYLRRRFGVPRSASLRGPRTGAVPKLEPQRRTSASANGAPIERPKASSRGSDRSRYLHRVQGKFGWKRAWSGRYTTTRSIMSYSACSGIRRWLADCPCTGWRPAVQAIRAAKNRSKRSLNRDVGRHPRSLASLANRT